MSIKRLTTTTAFVFLLFSACRFAYSQAPANPQLPKGTAVRAARMLDVKTGQVVSNAVILIANGRITSVGSGLAIPAGTEVIDLGDAMVLPGLIDCHTHLLENYEGALGGDDPNMILTVTQMSTAKRALLGVAMGRENLEAGITAVRDLGNSGLEWRCCPARRSPFRLGRSLSQGIH